MKNATCRSLLGGGSGQPYNCELKMVFANADNPSTSDETDGAEFFRWNNAALANVKNYQGAILLPATGFASKNLDLTWQGDAGDMDLDGMACQKNWASALVAAYSLPWAVKAGAYDMYDLTSILGVGWFQILINNVLYPSWASDGLVRIAIHDTNDWDAYLGMGMHGYTDATGESYAQMSLANPGAWLTKGFEIKWRCTFP